MGRQLRFILFRDRTGTWCAAPPGFRNLVRDPTGWGETRSEAVSELLSHPEFIHRAQRGEWPAEPGCSAFVEVPEPEGATFTARDQVPAYGTGAAKRPRPQLKLVWSRDG